MVLPLVQERLDNEWWSVGFYSYLANWCNLNGYEGGAKFFSDYASTEFEHMQKITQFIIDAGVTPNQAKIDSAYAGINVLEDTIMAWLKAQKKASANVIAIAQAALEEKDVATYGFISWFVEDQRVNEAEVEGLISWLQSVGCMDEDTPEWQKKSLRSKLDQKLMSMVS